ncbi:heme exporter protein CcmD [Moritella viscosa]|uniref:Heme exporter protein D n=1 Tax=Moritella viscosa TaxID=80854 RepID=A0A090KBH7_9GAMM|nr:heme exporter protein CcmD [Moritella viscosa]CED61223.1 heme exporter protein D (cytochrome c-type biogenesis protein CcmD) [Moritella viscosa]SGY88052.1 Heme exporter protein D [Moritella viscosa]SGY91254.1 Heme exporter protein D [Moritella viscosa]SGY91283.1 Heme exporter protein D [Moritella viscosa]SGY94296.1 Heme exporter protein D [Moritella viscosa]
MQFDSFSAFLAMGGYGFYVWLAVAFSVLTLGSLTVSTIVKRRQIINEIKNKHQRIKRMRAAEKMENTL